VLKRGNTRCSHRPLNTATVADIHKRSCRYPAGAAGLPRHCQTIIKGGHHGKRLIKTDGLPSTLVFVAQPWLLLYCRISLKTNLSLPIMQSPTWRLKRAASEKGQCSLRATDKESPFRATAQSCSIKVTAPLRLQWAANMSLEFREFRPCALCPTLSWSARRRAPFFRTIRATFILQRIPAWTRRGTYFLKLISNVPAALGGNWGAGRSFLYRRNRLWAKNRAQLFLAALSAMGPMPLPPIRLFLHFWFSTEKYPARGGC